MFEVFYIVLLVLTTVFIISSEIIDYCLNILQIVFTKISLKFMFIVIRKMK